MAQRDNTKRFLDWVSRINADPCLKKNTNQLNISFLKRLIFCYLIHWYVYLAYAYLGTKLITSPRKKLSSWVSILVPALKVTEIACWIFQLWWIPKFQCWTATSRISHLQYQVHWMIWPFYVKCAPHFLFRILQTSYRLEMHIF